MSNSVSLKMLGQKLVKLDCIIISLDLDTIKKARNELDRTCGWSVVFFCNRFFWFVQQKNIFVIRIKTKSFTWQQKYLLNGYLLILLLRAPFRTPVEAYGGAPV